MKHSMCLQIGSADPIETDKIYQTGTIITESHRIV